MPEPAPHPAKMKGNVLFGALAGNLSSDSIAHHSQSIEAGETDVPPSIASAFQTIDSKASGLLTHVSMMIAGLGICAPLLTNHPIEEALIVFEICVYLLIAVGCLRCLSVIMSRRINHGDSAHRLQHVRRELVIRHELYRLCNRVSIVFTILVFLSLLAMLWWDPIA